MVRWFKRKKKKELITFNLQNKIIEVNSETPISLSVIASHLTTFAAKNDIEPFFSLQPKEFGFMLSLSDGWTFSNSSLRTMNRKEKKRYHRKTEAEQKRVVQFFETRHME